MLYPNGTRSRPRVSSPYGPRDSRVGVSSFHAGADLIGYDIIHAVSAGVVTFAGWMNGAAGNAIVIDHGNGVTSVYMHNASHKVKRGQHVTEGQAIAVMGSTGNATGDCNHLEIRIHGKSTEPLAYIAARLPKPTTTSTTNTTGDDEMIQNIGGKAGKRSGGTYLFKDGKATFLGYDKRSKLPYITDEAIIRNLAQHYAGLPA